MLRICLFILKSNVRHAIFCTHIRYLQSLKSFALFVIRNTLKETLEYSLTMLV